MENVIFYVKKWVSLREIFTKSTLREKSFAILTATSRIPELQLFFTRNREAEPAYNKNKEEEEINSLIVWRLALKN